MEKSAPLEIIQSADQPTEDLHQGAGEQLTNLGQPAQTVPDTQKPIPLTDELRQIGVDATHVIGSKLEQLTTGTTPSSEVRNTGASKFIDFFKRRLIRKPVQGEESKKSA